MWAVKHPSYDSHFEYVKFNSPAIVKKFSNDMPLRNDSYLSICYRKTCGYSLLFQFGQQKAVDSFWICVRRPHDGRFAASQKDAATSTIIAARSPGFSKRFRSSQSSRVTWSVRMYILHVWYDYSLCAFINGLRGEKRWITFVELPLFVINVEENSKIF